MVPEHLIPKDFNFSPDVQTNPAFLFADGLSFGAAEIAASEARSNSLVKAPKSPTRENNPEEAMEYAYTRSQALFKQQMDKHCSYEQKAPVEFEHARTRTPKDALGCKTIIEFREWQEAYRIRTEAECVSGSPPPSQSGVRESDTLTARAATKIAESCEFMHIQNGGFKTFVTGTLSPESRKKLTTLKPVPIEESAHELIKSAGPFSPIEFKNGELIKSEKIEPAGARVYKSTFISDGPCTPIRWELESTVQKEVTRTMDAMQKMYKRGWQKKDGTKVDGHENGLPYLWVVEVPDNEHGEPNPHIHMLMGWSVEYKHFHEWAKRIEGIWKHGYFKLEKIKDTSAAGAYMAKAAGYLCKAQDKTDQGTVQGNRYGISKAARAPSWVHVNHAQMHTMGQLIYDVYDHLTVTYGEKYRERKKLNDALTKIPKENNVIRNKIGKRLARVRKELKAVPIRCNKYQLVVTGKAAAMSLFTWLKTPTSEEFTNNNEEWLPVKPEGWEWEAGPKPKAENSQFFTAIYRKFSDNKFWRRLNVPAWMRESNADEYWHSVKHEYNEFVGIEKQQDFCVSEYYAMGA